jgi:hypothetical protein
MVGEGGAGGGTADFSELKFRERFHFDKECMKTVLKISLYLPKFMVIS